jgi:hypothetical protein
VGSHFNPMSLRSHSLLPLSAFVALAFFSGCATTAPKVASHPDTAVNYSAYKSFALIRSTGLSAAKNPDLTPRLLRETRTATELAFAARGLTTATPQDADLLVHVHGALADKLDVTDYGLNYGRFGRGYALRGGGQEISLFKEGTLLIDVFDARTKELVWRGSAIAEVDAVPKPETIKGTVDAVVARYPN